MNKVAFVMSGVLTFLGIILLAWTRAVTELFPKIGYLVFKASGPGSYSPGQYAVDVSGVKVIAVICIIAGLILCAVFYGIGGKCEKSS